MLRCFVVGLFLVVGLLLTPSAAVRAGMPDSSNAVYVCLETGDNKSPGTKSQPYQQIDKALKAAKGGETILVCEGVYGGTFGIGYLESAKAVKLYGGYSRDFAQRDPLKYQTRIQPDNKSGAKSRKPLLTFTSEVDGLVVDGFLFDMGLRNSYHASDGKPQGVASGMLLLPPAKAGSDAATVTEPCLSIPSAAKQGSVLISNNVFANCASFGLQAGVRGGTFTVSNNVFVANRMAAAEIYGTCRAAGAGPSGKLTTVCGTVQFDHNTVLFTWSRLKDFLDMGYGFRVMTMLEYNIHDNIFGGNVQAAIDHSRFNGNAIRIDRNGFFVNKNADLEFSPDSNTKLTLRAKEFKDLELASVQGNTDTLPKGFPVDKAYLEGFLSARYSEHADYNPDSSANVLREVMGLNKQGKLKTSVSMFANRYPVEQAAKLFGGSAGMGAQLPR